MIIEPNPVPATPYRVTQVMDKSLTDYALSPQGSPVAQIGSPYAIPTPGPAGSVWVRCFLIGADGNVYQTGDPDWDPPNNSGLTPPRLVNSPSFVLVSAFVSELFGIGRDGNLYYEAWSDGWLGWSSLGGGNLINSPSAVVSWLLNIPNAAPPQTWRQPQGSATYIRSSDGASITLPIQVSIDPVLGRLAFPAGAIPVEPSQVQVSYSYGFSGDLGGGPYNRTNSLSSLLTELGWPEPPSLSNFWQAAITQQVLPTSNVVFSDLTSAIAAWNQMPAGSFGVIAILDSHTYNENLTGPNQILIPDGSKLFIIAADWPSLRLTGSSSSLVLNFNGVRSHLRGNIEVQGTAAAASDNAGTLLLNGLLIEGTVTVLAGNLGALQLAHTTLVPASGGLTAAAAASNNQNLSITLQRTICGPINLASSIPALNTTDSILDAGTGTAIDAPGADGNIQSTTVFGSVGSAAAPGLRTLNAGNSIFNAAVNIERLQAGCVRFCSVPPGISKVPRRYHCQPDLALENITAAALQAEIEAELAPSFTATQYGDPGYAQLSTNCASQIRTGGDNDSEIGAFYYLNQPQRDSNLRTALLEYLRFGLQAGIFYVS